MALKISISGVRGLVPETLTPEVCLDFAKAFGTFLQESELDLPKKIVIGTDPRASSEFIKGIVFSGLLACGCQVIDIGICPTPTVGIMVRELKAAGGMVITASHNPLPWNGLKFLRWDGLFLNEKQATQLINIYRTKKFSFAQSRGVGTNNKAIDIHLKKILKTVKISAIRNKKFKVVVDCCNGAGSEIAIKLLNKLGCKVIPINCSYKLPFPHNPEPIPENLTELCAKVVESGAQIGFALDADADRLAIVSEEGRAIGEELTLVFATDFVFGQNHKATPRQKIAITNLSTTNALDDVVESYGGKLLRTKIGEIHVAEELKKLNALIGGEGNGGVIYPKVGYNRDAQTGMALILNLLATKNKSVSHLVREIPCYHTVKTKITCENKDQADDAIEKIKEIFKKNDLILTDGVKILLPSGWLHVRASNTEPVIRIIAESKSKKEAQTLVDQVLESIS